MHFVARCIMFLRGQEECSYRFEGEPFLDLQFVTICHNLFIRCIRCIAHVNVFLCWLLKYIIAIDLGGNGPQDKWERRMQESNGGLAARRRFTRIQRVTLK